eukprot:tig00020943_g16310.t3
MAERLPRVGLDIAFLLLAKRRAIVQMDQSKSLGEDTGLSVVAFLEVRRLTLREPELRDRTDAAQFQQTLEDATKHQNMALQEIRSFWRNMLRLSHSLAWEGANSKTERRQGGATFDAGGRASASAGKRDGRRRVTLIDQNGVAPLAAITGLEQRLATIEKSKARVEGAYQRLISKFPRSPALWCALLFLL